MSPTSRNNEEPAATETAPALELKGRAAPSGASRKPKGKTAAQPARRRVRVAEGIYKDRHGLAATVKVNGIQREIRFPPGTPLKTIRAQRDELRASLRTLPAGERHTLAHDAERYLAQVSKELVSMADRRHHIALWVQRFGHLRTLALSQHVALLNDQLHQWRETLSASACNHRRNALTNLVKVLYGRRVAADLIDLVRFAQPPPKPRWVERSHIAAVLAQLTPGSKTVVRLQFMHWTGMRPSQMGRLQPDDFRLDEPTPFVVVPRGKGGRLAAIARRRRAEGSPRVHGDPGVRELVLPERQQGAGAGGPEGRTAPVHRVPDSPLVRDRAAADRIRRGGHSGSVRAHRPRDDDDLRAAAVAETRGSDRASGARGPGAGTGSAGDSAGRNRWQ